MFLIRLPAALLLFLITSVTLAQTAPKIVGNWRSTEPTKLANGYYVTQEYHLTENRWELIETYAADSELKKILYGHRAEGSYKMQAGEPTQIEFQVFKQYLNYMGKDRSHQKKLGINSCAFPHKGELDITKSGCGPYQAVEKCPTEFNIVKIEQNQLSLGQAEKSPCTAEQRPTSFATPLKKIN